MSTDFIGISSLNEHVNSSAIEEDYCMHAVMRFHAQWMRDGAFVPAALKAYGVYGEPTLPQALRQRIAFGAGLGMFFLGSIPQNHMAAELDSSGDDGVAPTKVPDEISPFDGLISGCYGGGVGSGCPPASTPTAQEQVHVQVLQLVQAPMQWAQAMCGVVTVKRWDLPSARMVIRTQLQRAAFLGLKAVYIALPVLQEMDDATLLKVLTDSGSHDAGGSALGAANDEMLCAASDVLKDFIESSGGSTDVWMSCDAYQLSHRRQFCRLQHILVHGYDADVPTNDTAAPQQRRRVTIRTVTSADAPDKMRREAVSKLFPVLRFCGRAEWDTVSTEWLGEDVAAFEVPPAAVMHRYLAPGIEQPPPQECSPPQQHLASGTESPQSRCSLGSDFYKTLASHQRSVGEPESLEAADNSKGSNDDEVGSAEKLRQALWGSSMKREVPAHHREGLAKQPLHVDPQRQSQPLRKRFVYTLPEDLQPSNASRWGTHHPARVTLITFLVELLRRRALPLFGSFFFDHYTILNYLHFAAAADAARDLFAGFEDVLQLPLQPLEHQLASGVYEVFERDSTKYAHYREAVYRYMSDWLKEMHPSAHHGRANEAFLETHRGRGSGAGGERAAGGQEEECFYVVLLGCGRGPLVDECLSAASALGLQVRIFAIEKNPPAASFTRLRLMCDPEWRHVCNAFGHTIEVIDADGRTVYDRRAELQLPWDFGLCDLVVSELLGSFGDNELSPECLETFHKQLCRVQAEKGITANTAIGCIPQSYTAFVAPVHSKRFEQTVAGACFKGLTTRPEYCPNRYTALYHSVFVNNLCRGMLLAPPQPCWTFTHFAAAPAGGERNSVPQTGFKRKATLIFEVAPQGRCSGFAGYFKSVLYKSPFRPTDEDAVVITTEPSRRTQDMYSWFPCMFPLDPTSVAELATSQAQVNSKSATVTIVAHLQRRVDTEGKRVWYTWGVQYPNESSAATPPMVLMNENGWAASMQL